jgi:DNA ligase (NAD+)
LPETEGKYKNPRNLCSGSVRQLNNKITAERNVGFYAFSVVKADVDFNNSRISQLNWLKNQGFSIVEFKSFIFSFIKSSLSSIPTIPLYFFDWSIF